jgi:putative ABC transport system substrate-binding protein
VDAILKGKKPGEMEVKFARGSDLFLNVRAAVKLGITLSDEMLQRASNNSK